MPRPKTGIFTIPPDGPSGIIRGVLELIHVGNDAPDSPLRRQILHLLFTVQRFGAPPWAGDFEPEWRGLPDNWQWKEENLFELIRCGFYLRTCTAACGRFFLTHDKRQNNCHSEPCLKAGGRKRQARAREVERIQNSVTLKRTRRTK